MSILSDYERATAPLPGRAHALPLRAYSDSEVFDLEMERVFRHDWFAVCGADELPDAGDYYAFTVTGEPIVVIRGHDCVLRAFSNVCRHRGTVLYDEGRGNARAISCRYHAWSYDACGRLTEAPLSGNTVIDKASHGLVTIQLEVWQGIVFINLAADAQPLAPRLAGADRYIDNFQFDRLPSGPPWPEQQWNANWKVVLENGMDWYHLFRAHPKTLEPFAPTRNAFNIEGSPLWTVTASRLTQATPKRPGDPASIGAFERENYFVLTVPPNVTFFATSDSWYWQSVLPQSADQTTVCGGGRYAPGEDALLTLEAENYESIMEEDRNLCERIQKGMSSRHGRGGQLVELDRAINDFHHYLGWRLFDHELAEPWQAKSASELRAASDSRP